MEPIISIIIPIYNVEKYLKQCLESVLAQTYRSIEIILVDDGSPDSCGAICDEYALRDKRIKVIHKENGGASDARNVGILKATGEYIIFLDGDDLWEDKNSLQRLITRQKKVNADVLNYSYVRWFEDIEQKQPYFNNVPAMPKLSTKKEQLDYLSSRGLYIASPCNKLIRRSVLNDIEFRQGVYSEDIEWCAKLLIQAKSMDFICENFYLYRQHSSSARYTITEKKCFDLVENICKCIELEEKTQEDNKSALLHYIAFQYGTFFKVQSQTEKVPTECIERMSNYSWVLKNHGSNKKLIVLFVLCRIIGYKKTCKLIRMIYKKH